MDLTVEKQPDTSGETELRQRGSESKGSTSRWPKTSSQSSESQDIVKADESVDSKAEVQPRGGKSSEVSLAIRDKTENTTTEVSLMTIRDKTETTEVTVVARDRDKKEEGTVQILTSGVTGSEYQQIVSSLMDMRVDLKLEIQRLNLKVSRIDEHLVELVKKMPRLPEDDRTDYRRVSDHSTTKHSSSTSKGGKGHHSGGPSKKKGAKSKSWTSPKSPSQAPPNDSSAVRAMLENEIEELHKESLPNETQ